MEPLELLETPHGQEDKQDKYQSGRNRDKSSQARDGRNLAAEGMRPNLPSLCPVGTYVLVVCWRQGRNQVIVWDTRLRLRWLSAAIHSVVVTPCGAGRHVRTGTNYKEPRCAYSRRSFAAASTEATVHCPNQGSCSRSL